MTPSSTRRTSSRTTPPLTAAVRFTRDQAGRLVGPSSQSHNLATVTYLEARRRDLAATGFVPYVRVYGSTQPELTVRSRPGGGSGAAIAGPSGAAMTGPSGANRAGSTGVPVGAITGSLPPGEVGPQGRERHP